MTPPTTLQSPLSAFCHLLARHRTLGAAVWLNPAKHSKQQWLRVRNTHEKRKACQGGLFDSFVCGVVELPFSGGRGLALAQSYFSAPWRCCGLLGSLWGFYHSPQSWPDVQDDPHCDGLRLLWRPSRCVSNRVGMVPLLAIARVSTRNNPTFFSCRSRRFFGTAPKGFGLSQAYCLIPPPPPPKDSRLCQRLEPTFTAGTKRARILFLKNCYGLRPLSFVIVHSDFSL